MEVCRRVTAAAKVAGRFGGYPDPTGDIGGATRPASSRSAGDAAAHPGASEAAGSDCQAGGCRTAQPPDGDEGGCGTAQPPDGDEADGCGTSGPEAQREQCATTRAERAGPDGDGVDPHTLAAALAGLGAGGAKATLMVILSLTDLQRAPARPRP